MVRAKDMRGWEVGFANLGQIGEDVACWNEYFVFCCLNKRESIQIIKRAEIIGVTLIVWQLSQADCNHSRLYPLTFSYDPLEQGPPGSMSKPDKERSSESERLRVHLIYLSNHSAFKARLRQASTSYQSGRSK